uniref:holo-[acyl-carrier-protein] synthase n=1 Tax=Setaria italica TaxID=4555 RepID=K3YJB3_SETIT
MRQCLLRRAMPLPPPPPPRTPGVTGGRLLSSLSPPPRLQSRREVHIWYLSPDELNDASQLKMYMELLSPSERKNALSMNGENLQKVAVLSRALIGIDIEEKKRNTAKNVLSLADRYFTPSEFDHLVNLPDPDAQQKEFIKLWTLKEAYVKALGRGFSGAPFNKFSIILAANNGIQISVEPKALNDSNSSCDCLSENWKFALAELYGSYYMAACMEDDSRSSGLFFEYFSLHTNSSVTLFFFPDIFTACYRF